MSLTIDQLFTPATSGVGPNPNTVPAQGTWLATLLSSAAIVGLPTTSWQPGSPERTILAMTAVSFAQQDFIISMMAQGGFLDFAADGTVSVTALNGVTTVYPVTPDPSNPAQNPAGAPGWLDALGTSFYDVTRLQATYASGPLAVANTTGSTLNYVAGNYHVANTVTFATYTNTQDIAIPTSSIGTGGIITGVVPGTTTTVNTSTSHGLAVNQTVYFSGVVGITGINGQFATVATVGSSNQFTVALNTSGTWTSGGTVYLCTVIEVQADVIGISSNAAAGQITTAVTASTGVFVDNLTSLSASNYETNDAYAARCRLKLASLSPNGPAAAYNYFALTAQELLADETPPVTLTNGAITNAVTFSNPQTEVVTCVVSSSTPQSIVLGSAVTPGCAQNAITNATNASPIVVTTSSPLGLTISTQQAVVISGVLGNTAANGGKVVTVTGANTFSINGSTGTGAYTSGGIVDGGDLGQVDAILRANVVPDGITLVTQSALAFPVTVVATVIVPQAYLATYQVAAPIALQQLLASYPIGGNPPSGGGPGVIPYSAISGALFDAGVLTVGQLSYVREVSPLTVNGTTADVPFTDVNYVAILATPTITVIGV